VAGAAWNKGDDQNISNRGALAIMILSESHYQKPGAAPCFGRAFALIEGRTIYLN
jgi:hypothetical protein